jgi:hypothetical protein
MHIIGFTGSRELLDEESLEIERVLYTLNGDRVVTGACIGVDEFVAEWFLNHRPSMKQTILVPGDRSRVNMAFIDRMLKVPADRVEVVFMHRTTSYAQRNIEIVKRSTLIIGFPRYRESHIKSARSGTWQTLRKARLTSKVVRHYVLSELVDAV